MAKIKSTKLKRRKEICKKLNSKKYSLNIDINFIDCSETPLSDSIVLPTPEKGYVKPR